MPWDRRGPCRARMPPLHVPGIHGARSWTLTSRWPLSTAPRLHIDFSPCSVCRGGGCPNTFHRPGDQPHSFTWSTASPSPPFGACSHVGRVIDKGPSRPASSCSAGHHHCFHSQPTSCSPARQTYDYRLCSALQPPSPTLPSVLNVNEVLISTAIKLQTDSLPNQPVSDRAKMVFPANQMPIRFGKTLHGLTDNQSPLEV